jgi:hypothetical protein
MKTIKEVPILFSTPMVQAILDGRKTQTRRIAKLPDGTVKCWHDGGEWIAENDLGNCWQEPLKPKCEAGDLLWVRETWAKNLQDGLIDFKASYASESHFYGWKPSIHMPKAACRIWLRCTGVKAERVQDITESDAIAEGIAILGRDSTNDYKPMMFQNYHHPYTSYTNTAKSSFHTLWHVINGPESWDANVWVWIYSFKVISTIGKPTNG